MKVRVCPACGKVNKEDAFNCVDCEQTLSIKTLMDTDSEQFLNATPFAGGVALINVSPAFQAEAAQILKAQPDGEVFLWGCNTTTLSCAAPFKFGFLIFTAEQLILTYFDSDLDEADFPERSNLAYLPTALDERNPNSFGSHLLWALDFPNSDLTPGEIDTRSVTIFDLKHAVSARIEQQIVGDAALVRMIAKFTSGSIQIPDFLRPENGVPSSDEISITFIFPEDADKALAYFQYACI